MNVADGHDTSGSTFLLFERLSILENVKGIWSHILVFSRYGDCDPSITDESVDNYLEKAQKKVLERGDKISAKDEIADSVFMQSYIPKTLDDVVHAEEDVNRITNGQDTGDMLYHTITGLKEELATAQTSLPREDHQQQLVTSSWRRLLIEMVIRTPRKLIHRMNR
ncbi:hypothetical protein AgCh_037302 [Apium graveolens]